MPNYIRGQDHGKYGDRSAHGGNAVKWFHAWMALTCLTVAVVGFAPTYFVPLAKGTFQAQTIIHIHGLAFFGWTAYFCFQTWLVAQGKTLKHRDWGMAGIALATAMVFLVFATVVVRVNYYDAHGYGHAAKVFSWVQVSGALFFAVVIALAIANIRLPDVHKRLMLLATISLLDAPIARWFAVLLSPPLAAGEIPSPPPVMVTVPPALLSDILLIVAMVFDWRTRGKPHAVYVLGTIALVALQVSRVPISGTEAWLAAADWIAALGR